MKQSSCLRLLPYLFAVLLLFCACHDDAMPEQPASTDTEPPEALDAYHDKIREKPYPKADNELYLNPSPLIVPQTMKTGAKLQFSLSRSKNFDTPETVTSQAVAWCMFNPHKKLENGTWYWRFRNISADGTEEAWSEIHPFEVKETTPVFVTPPFETFRQYAPHTYPRLYCFLDDRIQEARQEASSHSEYQRLIQNAADALKADLTAIGNPYSQINVIKRYVQSLYQAYYLTQQETYAKRLHELLQLLLNTPVSDAVLFADNFGSTNIAYCFLKPYDLLYKRLSSEERQSVEDLLMRVLRFYYPQQQGTQENRIFDNHFWQQNLRVLFQATFLLYDNEALQDEVLPIMEYYYELWTARAPASGFNRDGMWANGTGYFNNNVYTLFYMQMLLSHITRKDFLLHPWYRNAGQALTFTCPPESRNIGFGDNSEKYTTSTYQYAAFADFLARETEDGYAGWYARQAVTTCNTEKAFTATTSLFSNEQITLSQTDRFTVPPTEASDTTYPNQWHLTACIDGKAKTRILAVIQIKPDNDTPVKIQRNGNILTCGYWTIEAGLDASSPAMLNVTHSMKKSSFHYGNASLVLGGQSYVPADRSSSILYDKINGEYLVMEQADHRPLSTRASSR